MDADILFWRLSRPLRLLIAGSGVAGSPTEFSDSVSVPRDGIDSLDMDRIEDNGPGVVSLSKLQLSGSASSGGLSNIPHDCGLDEEIARLGISLLSVSCSPFAARMDPLRQSSERGWYLDWGNEVMASKAATDEGVEDESWGLPASCRVRSLDMDSLLFLRSRSLVLVGITTGLVADWGVSIFGGRAVLATLSFVETRSVVETGIFPLSLGLVEGLEGAELYRYARGTIIMEGTGS